jgi:tRNA threonylcarbamoyladenosine biosynthesis protein TsaB
MTIGSPILLLIETSTDVCSVAISSGEEILASRVLKEPRSHARVVAPMVSDLLSERGIDMAEVDGVVVSKGPGSYTGLRVGVSLAKGLCYGASKPLIAVCSLELLANLALKQIEGSTLTNLDEKIFIVPMIDARRMEVYTAVYDADCNRLEPVQALVVDEGSFKSYLERGVVYICGDGSSKVKTIVNHPNARYLVVESLATGMLKRALQKYKEAKFEDLAYFEPFYLKDFIAGIPKKKGLS